MPSIFPGIDPFLEAQGLWPDFHVRFINNLGDALMDLMPDNYEARIGENFQVVEYESEKQKKIGPDLSVAKLAGKAKSRTSAGAATLEPITVPLLIEEEIRETYLKIIWRPDRSIVTIIEVLSPSNKEPSGRNLYLSKRRGILYQSIHLVEIDFLLGGRRLPLLRDYPPGDFFALVSRVEKRPDCEVYAWPLSAPLPTIPIPLKKPDLDVMVDLAAVFALTFSKGKYTRSIDYQHPLGIRLSRENKTLMKDMLAAQS